MALTFPNRSRSYDEGRDAIRFLGYDGMFEVPFFIEVEALAGPGGQEMSETSCLHAFDASRGLILDAARAAYLRRRRISYVLTSDDLQRPTSHQ
ncbi:DUF1488 domain-containing protein [Aquamicrobium sp. LC103]|uniref:DUF1488 domain-containing protein n=1 Tax=Aquamicrobium sp. LC103 TaxID=1120658 RepID=UPI00063ECCCE|nr:DUF1488 domain-containing protein [Aquamicrobium sp. LC103]TKT69105.1 DUF1488 domain-containing protein [Aquamicrobium sp. LC103]